MNPYGSYRALLGNSISAMLAAIEVYNKPRIEYRSECCVILLLNAWELLLKGILSKNRTRIFEPKERGKPYRTLKLWDAFEAARPYFPQDIPWEAVGENIGRLADYRNNVVHFYNSKGLDVIVYSLAQTAIVNYRDIARSVFDRDIASEVNIALLPLSFSAPPDPISFLGQQSDLPRPASEFLRLISETTRELEEDGVDTARFFTVFEVNLQSTKKIQSADIVAGIGSSDSSDVLLVSRKVDPNKSHPWPQKKIGSIRIPQRISHVNPPDLRGHGASCKVLFWRTNNTGDEPHDRLQAYRKAAQVQRIPLCRPGFSPRRAA